VIFLVAQFKSVREKKCGVINQSVNFEYAIIGELIAMHNFIFHIFTFKVCGKDAASWQPTMPMPKSISSRAG
jgi:hypothetical protein